MGRRYAAGNFVEIVNKIRARFPTATIATDVIVGFPTETWKEFMDTVRLIEQTKPVVLNTSRYSPMPHTRAATMPQIPFNAKKRRSRFITSVHLCIAREENEKLVGEKKQALVIEKVKGVNWHELGNIVPSW